MRLRSQAGPQFPRLVPSSVGCLPCCEPSLAFATTSPTTTPDVSESSFAFLPCAAASALVSKAAETAGGSFAPLRVPRFARVSLLLSAGCLVLSLLSRKKQLPQKEKKKRKSPTLSLLFALKKKQKGIPSAARNRAGVFHRYLEVPPCQGAPAVASGAGGRAPSLRSRAAAMAPAPLPLPLCRGRVRRFAPKLL